jgi:hypothetical protein
MKSLGSQFFLSFFEPGDSPIDSAAEARSSAIPARGGHRIEREKRLAGCGERSSSIWHRGPPRGPLPQPSPAPPPVRPLNASAAAAERSPSHPVRSGVSPIWRPPRRLRRRERGRSLGGWTTLPGHQLDHRLQLLHTALDMRPIRLAGG